MQILGQSSFTHSLNAYRCPEYPVSDTPVNASNTDKNNRDWLLRGPKSSRGQITYHDIFLEPK